MGKFWYTKDEFTELCMYFFNDIDIFITATWRPMAPPGGRWRNFRGDVTRWRHRGDARWQGRDLYPGQSDLLTWPISRSEWLIGTWRYLWLATWRPMAELPGRVLDWLDLYPGQSDWLTRDGTCDWPMAELPGWRHTVTSQRRHLVIRHDIWWRHRKYVISRDTF